jgi:hypothetical protein
MLYIEPVVFISDLIHCRLGVCNWTRANIQILFPEAQSKGISSIFWWYHCGTSGLASGGDAN